MLEVFMYKAQDGDFLRIHWGNETEGMHNILIDGGRTTNKATIINVIDQIYNDNEPIDAIVISHIDNDHVIGMYKALGTYISRHKNNRLRKVLKKIYMNTHRGVQIYIEENKDSYGVKEAIELMDLFKDLQIHDRIVECTESGTCENIGGAILNFISPDKKRLTLFKNKWEKKAIHLLEENKVGQIYTTTEKNSLEGIKDGRDKSFSQLMMEDPEEDTSVENGSSLAFIFEFEGHRLAFLGDAFPSVCIEGLKKCKYELPLQLDLLKLSHHGSQHNITDDLLQALPAKKYLISTKKVADRPHKMTFAHLIKNNPNGLDIYLNENWWVNEKSFFTKEGDQHFIDIDNPNDSKNILRLHYKENYLININ